MSETSVRVLGFLRVGATPVSGYPKFKIQNPKLLVLFALALVGAVREPPLHVGGRGLAAGANRSPASPGAGPAQVSPWQRYELSGSDVQAVDVVDAGNAWAVGSDGLLAHWDGTSWTAYDNTTLGSPAYTGVDALSAGAAWTVAGRTVVRWDGTAWTTEPTNTGSATMNDISMASPSDGWIVGSDGTLARYNGTSWQVLPSSAVTLTMYGVDVVDANNAWAVGGRIEHGIVGKIAHWDGTAWTQVLSTNQVLYAVDMLDASYGWAVGFDGALWRWDGTNWTRATPPYTGLSLRGVSVVSRTDAWATGSNNDVWHWDGASWSAVPAPSGPQLVGVAMRGAADGWAVGQRGTIYHWDGMAWTVSTSRSTTNGYYAIDFLGRNDGWAVGVIGTSPLAYGLQHWNGTTWQPYPLSYSLALVMDVDMVASSDVWAVGGDGYIFHWDGTSWSRQLSPGGSLFAVSMVSAADGWAAGGNGSSGSIVHYDGMRWVDYPISTTTNIHAIAMVDANEGWAGGIGLLLHYQKGVWTQVTPAPDSINGFHMFNRDEGWAVGFGGAVLHYQNGVWTPQVSPTTASLERVHMISPNEGWAVGSAPGMGGASVLLHYLDGTSSLLPHPTGRALRDVYAFDANEGWAVGDPPGIVLHYRGGPGLTATPTATRTPTPPAATPTPTAPPRTPTATATATPTGTPTPCAISFSDVRSDDYFYEAVRYLYCHGVISGYLDGTFRPYNLTTRAQLCKIVALGFRCAPQGWAIYTPATPTFRDVPATHVFYQYIETAYHQGIISGYGCGTGCLEFRPGNNVTRGQLCKIVVLAEGWPIYSPPAPTFRDVPTGDTFYTYVETAYRHGIISGYSCGAGPSDFGFWILDLPPLLIQNPKCKIQNALSSAQAATPPGGRSAR